MTTYAQQLDRWAQSLAAGSSEALLADIAPSSSQNDIARYLENAMGERRRLLLEELSFVALAFDDFESLVDEYLGVTPRRTYGVSDRDQERFLEWLRHRPLNAQQQDFVTCQQAAYACYAMAQKNRVAHLNFQRLLREREQGTETKSERNTLLVNPVHVWSRLEVAMVNEGESQPGDVVFVAVADQIRSLWLTDVQSKATRSLTKGQPMQWNAWRMQHPELNAEQAEALCQELIDGGLIARV